MRLLSLIKKYPVLLVSLVVGLSGCSRTPDMERPEKMLARIGDKSITVNEFIRRAEYTPRPPYCNTSTYPHKKIVLNSLIAEKLFALEAGENNPLITSPKIQAYLQGRKEQTMREYLFLKEGYEGVEIDTTTLKRTVVNASRRYQVKYFSVNDSSSARRINERLRVQREPMLYAMQSYAAVDSLPQREIVWAKSEHNAIIDSVFVTRRQQGDVIGPIKISPDQFMFLQVHGIEQEMVMTNEQLHERWKEVQERLTDKVARTRWDQHVLSVMKGKRIEFNRDTFFKTANLLGPVYLRSFDEQKASFEQRMWDRPEQDINWEDYLSQVKAMAGESLFKVDDEVWTVERFFREVQIHPLVFREKNIKNKEFGKQLQLAIIDMMRDHFLTKECYKQGYDALPAVERDVAMWRDHLNYLFHKDAFLRARGDSLAANPHYVDVIDRYLNAYVDSLQRKHSGQIQIDLQAFEKIRLTRIDMSVIQEIVPYVKVVPGFPLVTTSFRLDYGREMDKKKD